MSVSSLAASLPVDGRQSPTALEIARGTTRLLHSLGFSVVSELPLASGRRADLVALGAGGEFWIVEIKSSIADFRADRKWSDYRRHCDRLFFATTLEVPVRDFPARHRPDRGGRLRRGDRVRGAGASPARRDPPSVMLAFARAAALRPRGARRSAGADGVEL